MSTSSEMRFKNILLSFLKGRKQRWMRKWNYEKAHESKNMKKNKGVRKSEKFK